MDTTFINSYNSKTSNQHVLKLKLTSKLDLRISEKVIALSNLSIYYTWRNVKSSYNNNNLKYQHLRGMTNWSYQMDLILYQIFKIISDKF